MLKLDFSEAATGSVEDMNALLTEHINRQCLVFGAKYGYDVSTGEDASATNLEVIVRMHTLTTLAEAVRVRGEELYLFADEYDRYANVCLLDREDVDQDGYRQAVTKRFFSTLKFLEGEGCLSASSSPGCCGWTSASASPPTTFCSPAHRT